MSTIRLHRAPGEDPGGELSGKRGAFQIVTAGAISPDRKEERIECTTHNCFDIALLPSGCIGIEVLDAAPEVPRAADRKLGGFRLQLELMPAGVFRI